MTQKENPWYNCGCGTTIKTYHETKIEKQQLNFEELQLVSLVPSVYENQ